MISKNIQLQIYGRGDITNNNMDTLFAIIGCVILSVVIVIGISIKEKTNVFENLYQFFGEWGDYLIKYAIPFTIFLGIIAIFCWAWLG